MSPESEWKIPTFSKISMLYNLKDKITDDEFLNIIKNLVEREIIII